MEIAENITRMADHAASIHSLTQGIAAEQARWRPAAESWSILEVINHLYDEEREDFRVRLDHILHQPGRDFPPIDPQGWVTARKYNERDLAESVANFLAEREKSLDWLGGLGTPDWEAFREAPWGKLRAGDMLAAWVAHDVLHLRQLVELHYALAARDLNPYRPDYAGEW